MTELFRHRSLLFRVMLAELRSQHASTILGTAWVFLYPLAFLSVYAFVFLFILNVRPLGFTPVGYVLLIFCGLVPFLSASESITAGASSVLGNMGLLRNTLFPIELVPVKTVLLSQVPMTVGVVMIIVATTVSGHTSSTLLLLPPVWVLFICFLTGLAWTLSVVTVFVRDIIRILPIVILLLMMVSPIAYTIEMVPSELRFVCYVNPLAHFIWAFQDILVRGKVPAAGVWAGIVAWGVVSPLIGYGLFMRAKRELIENL
ncbi:ABC transporter permease [Bradyrhizobium mercantei]|uniref:ABC transporter permease n=1 Tax=Bradyrhizobium mercantei TaxID=1904807 RepID=UPI001AECE8B9|nr:ABC transporter permease [Bradyrhizobium mercantei]